MGLNLQRNGYTLRHCRVYFDSVVDFNQKLWAQLHVEAQIVHRMYDEVLHNYIQDCTECEPSI